MIDYTGAFEKVAKRELINLADQALNSYFSGLRDQHRNLGYSFGAIARNDSNTASMFSRSALRSTQRTIAAQNRLKNLGVQLTQPPKRTKRPSNYLDLSGLRSKAEDAAKDDVMRTLIKSQANKGQVVPVRRYTRTSKFMLGVDDADNLAIYNKP